MLGLVLCSGKGTRLKPLTDYTSKCMVKVAGKPILERQVEYLIKGGVNNIIVNLSPECHPRQIMNYFGSRILYLFEPVRLGEENTERIIKGMFNQPMVIMNGDTLTEVPLDKLILYENSVQFWQGRYAGIKFLCDLKQPAKIDFKCWWQDCGTWEGLKKAEEHYAGN